MDVIERFRSETRKYFHTINDCTAENFEDVVYHYINSYIEEYYPSIELVDVVLVGSRSRGLENDTSDMDFVFEYAGEMKEYEMFNALNKSNLNLAGVKIDINPIRKEETGTLEDYLPKVEEYLQGKSLDRDILSRCTTILYTHGYPIFIGDKVVSFPEEYEDVFTVAELNRLEGLLIEKRGLEKKQKLETNHSQFFSKEIDEWDKNDIRKSFMVSRTSAAMGLIGVEDKPITLDAVKLKRVMKTHSEMSLDIIKQIPNVIDDPVLIMESKQSNTRIVVSGELYDKDNKAVVVILELEPKGKDGVVLDEIKVASAYGKNHLDNLIVTSKLLYVSDDKEKINRWIKNTGLQLPFDLSSIDSIDIISQGDKNATVEYQENSMNIFFEKNSEGEKGQNWESRIDDIVSDVAWTKNNDVLQKGGNKMGRENPISVYVDNLRKYTEGDADGKWLELPMTDEELKKELDTISNNGRDEMMISDIGTREDCQYMYDMIHEFDNIYELNVVAKLIGNNPHPAVEMYLKYDDNLSMAELSNLIFNEDKINYSPYEFDGIDNLNTTFVLSNEEKLGYTLLESNALLKDTLERLDIDGTSIMNYINVEAIGRDMVLSGFVTVGENGFLDSRSTTINLEEYSIEEINQEINERLEIEKEQNQEVTQKTKHVLEPTPVGPKL